MVAPADAPRNQLDRAVAPHNEVEPVERHAEREVVEQALDEIPPGIAYVALTRRDSWGAHDDR
jgi:hypothetical protein